MFFAECNLHYPFRITFMPDTLADTALLGFWPYNTLAYPSKWHVYVCTTSSAQQTHRHKMNSRIDSPGEQTQDRLTVLSCHSTQAWFCWALGEMQTDIIIMFELVFEDIMNQFAGTTLK